MAKDVSIIVKAIDQVTGPIKEMRTGLDSFVGAIKGIGATAVGAALISFFKGAVKEASEAEDSVARLDTVLRTIGLTYQQVSPELEKYLNTLQRTTRFSDEDGREAFANLITITGDYKKSLELMGVSADVATKRQVSMAEGATIVGKASIGVVKGLGDMGVTTTKASDAIAQLTVNTKGLAEAAGSTFAGRIQILNNLWAEFKEQVGAGIINSEELKGSLSGLADNLVRLAEWVNKHGPDISNGLDKAVGAASAAGKAIIWFNEHFNIAYIILKKLMASRKETAEATVASETKMTTAVVQGGERRVTKTKEAIAAEEAVHKKAAAAREKAVTDSHKRLEQLDDVAAKAALELLSANHRAYEEIERTFRQKMEGMTKEDHAKAEALLKKMHDNQLLAWAGLNAKLDTEIPKAQQTIRGEFLLTAGVTTDFTAVLDKHGKKLDEGTAKTTAAKLRWADFKEEAAEVAFTIMDGADAMLAFLDALGLGDEKMDRLVKGIGELGEAAARLATGDIVGGIIKGIGGIKDVIGGLFGKSKAEKQLEEALNRNRIRLEELSRNIGDLNINLTGNQLAGTQAALKQFFATGGAKDKGWADRLGGLLLKQGITMSDLEEVAKTLNIELRPSGHLSPQMLQQLMQAIGLVEPTTFRTDFRGKKEQLAAETELFNLSPEEQAKRLAAIGAGELKGSTARAIGGLDFSAAGRAGSLSTIQGLFNLMKSGGIATADLGGLQPGEFLRLLEDLEGFIEDLSQSGVESLPDETVKDIVESVVPSVAEGLPGVSGLDVLELIQLDTHGIFELLQHGGGASGLGALTIQQGDITIQSDSSDPRQLADLVGQAVSRANQATLEELERQFGQNYLLNLRLKGDATRVIA